jgi:hypothetical protein
MTKYTIQSLDKHAAIATVSGWTPRTLHLLATIVSNPDDAWQFDTCAEATLAIFVLETDSPRLTFGMNFVVVPVSIPDPQQHFPL